MKTRYFVAITLLCVAVSPAPVVAQRAKSTPEKPVLFVCEHGTVKSLLAKVLFEQYAAQVGLPVTALSRGTNPDSLVPPWMLSGLSGDKFQLGSWRPQKLGTADLDDALMVVSFDVPSAATANARVPRQQWDSLPSVSRDYGTGRDAIKSRVKVLVDSLKRARQPRK